MEVGAWKDSSGDRFEGLSKEMQVVALTCKGQPYMITVDYKWLENLQSKFSRKLISEIVEYYFFIIIYYRIWVGW